MHSVICIVTLIIYEMVALSFHYGNLIKHFDKQQQIKNNNVETRCVATKFKINMLTSKFKDTVTFW